MRAIPALQKNDTITPGSFLTILNHFFFVLLFIFSCYYYKQRIYTDSSFYIYHVINKQAFHIEVNRFILAFSQALPLLLVKLKCSLKAVLIGYSVGHVLYFYLVYVWLAHVRKEPVIATLLVLTQTIGIMSGYFTPMFELYYCNALLVAFYVVLKQYNSSARPFILLLLLVFFISTGHPVANVLLLFILVFHAEEHGPKYYREYGAIVLLMVGIFIFKMQTVDPYEQGKSLAFIDTLRHAHFGMAYAKGFVQFLFTYYKDVLVLGSISWAWLLVTGKFRKALIYSVFLIVVVIMINGAHYGFEHTRYQEQVYFPLNFVVCFPFLVWVWGEGTTRARYAAMAVLVVVTGFRFMMIAKESIAFTNRTDLMETLIGKAQTLEGNKFVVDVAEVTLPGYTEPNWSYAPETLLLSGLSAGNKTVTICTSEDFEFDGNNEKLTPNQFLFRRWNVVQDNSVNQTYFRISAGKYAPITTAAPGI